MLSGVGRRGLWRRRQWEAESKTSMGWVEERAVSVSCLILESIHCPKVSRGCLRLDLVEAH